MKNKIQGNGEKSTPTLNTSLPKKQNSSLQNPQAPIETANLQHLKQQQQINILWESIKNKNKRLESLKRLRSDLQEEGANTLRK